METVISKIDYSLILAALIRMEEKYDELDLRYFAHNHEGTIYTSTQLIEEMRQQTKVGITYALKVLEGLMLMESV